MKLTEYQEEVLTFSEPFYDDLSHCALGLAGEAGEFCEHVKKCGRDRAWELGSLDRARLKLELGDIMFNVCAAARVLGFTLDEVARANIEKYADRARRGVLHGEGDMR